MDNLFHIIDGAQVIIKSRGVFYQKKVYVRGDRFYAQWGGGFIRIGSGDSTSCPNTAWENLDVPAGFISCKKGPLGEPLLVQP